MIAVANMYTWSFLTVPGTNVSWRVRTVQLFCNESLQLIREYNYYNYETIVCISVISIYVKERIRHILCL